MKSRFYILFILLILLSLSCFGSKEVLKLGNCPLTIRVESSEEDFDGFANVYINRKFIGTTDSQTRSLRVSLKKGEYTIIVMADGYQPWTSNVLLLGENYKQQVLAKIKPKLDEFNQ